MVVAILLLLALILILGRFLQTKKGKTLISAVKNFFFWNFLIRYF